MTTPPSWSAQVKSNRLDSEEEAGVAAAGAVTQRELRNPSTTRARVAVGVRGVIPVLNVILGGCCPVVGWDSGRRRLTRFRIVACGLTCQCFVAVAFPRASSVT
jgi:hypothetical protein